MFCQPRVGGVADIRNWSTSLLYAYFGAYLHKLIRGCDLNSVRPFAGVKKQKVPERGDGGGVPRRGMIYNIDDRSRWMHLCYHLS